MAVVTELWSLDIFLALLLCLLTFYFYYLSKINYWEERNIPYFKSQHMNSVFFHFILGRKAHADMVMEMYKQNKGEKMVGLFQLGKPALLINDLELITRICIKDFTHFENRGLPVDPENDPLTVSLVNLTGNQWRGLRNKLTPTFTSGKLKGMFLQMCNCGEEFLQQIEELAKTGEIVDTKSLVFTFTTDVIASCAFGLQIKSGSPEGKKFKEMVHKALGNTLLHTIQRAILMFYPKLGRLIGLKMVSSDVSDYFMNLTKATIEHRLSNNIKREDFLQLLLGLKQQDESEKQSEPGSDLADQDDVHLQYTEKSSKQENTLKITEEVVAAQTFTFLTAGTEPTSTTISVLLHYLAEYPEVQAKLQNEVDSVLARHRGQWSYDALKDMTYMDQVIQESQRMFPIAHAIMRKCTSTYKVPGLDVVIEKGVSVVIPTLPIHMDPAYYPDPEVFNPDRFEGNNYRPSAVYAPFGDGPRKCIAMMFSILEVKVFLAKALTRFTVKPSSKTITPLRYEPRATTNRPKGGVWVSFQKRNT